MTFTLKTKSIQVIFLLKFLYHHAVRTDFGI